MADRLSLCYDFLFSSLVRLKKNAIIPLVKYRYPNTANLKHETSLFFLEIVTSVLVNQILLIYRITLNYIELRWIIFLVCASSNHVIVSAFIVMPWFRINFKMRIDFKIRRLLVVAFTLIFIFSALRLTMLMILFVTNFTTFSYDICRCCE